MSKQVSIQK
jgi:hypothetical protein